MTPEKESHLTTAKPIPVEIPCEERARYLRILDKVIVALMLAILMVLSLPVLNAYHAPKSVRAVPPMRFAPPAHHDHDNRLIRV